MHAKALKRAVVKALKGRTKQELACEDVEAQAESDKMESEVLVTVEGKWRGFRLPESSLQAVCTSVYYGRGLQHQEDRWKTLAIAKLLFSMERVRLTKWSWDEVNCLVL